MNGKNKYSEFGRRAFSLKTKITVLVVFLILAILLSIGYLQIVRDQRLHEEYSLERAETVSEIILSFNVLGIRRIKFQDIQVFLNNFLAQPDLAEDILFISLHDESGKILAGSVNPSLVTYFRSEREVNGQTVIETVPVETQEDQLKFIDKIQRQKIKEINNNIDIVTASLDRDYSGDENPDEEVKTVVIGFSKIRANRQIINSLLVNLSIFSVYILIGVLASIFLGSAISRPIKVLEEAMKRVSAGDLNQRLEINSRDEIGTLAATFNYMTEGLREKEKIKKEFLVAREVQFNLLPEDTPKHDRLDIATYFEPATEVGGDYFDFLYINEDKIGVVIADVSGHGMSAGLLMAITKSCLHTQLTYQTEIDRMMYSMNNILCGLSEQRSLVTMFLSVLDLKESTVTFANAGHPFTYLIKNNSQRLIPLEAISYPLAVKKNLPFKAHTVPINIGDYLVYYSDGIIEALDEEGNLFGYDRIEELLKSRNYSNSRELLETLITEVRIHIGSAEQFDDITAVVVRLKS